MCFLNVLYYYIIFHHISNNGIEKLKKKLFDCPQLVTVPPTRPYYYETTTVQGPDSNLGYWNFMLDPFPSNTTVSINIQAEAGSLSLNDVIFGDVWICSGQSNMQFTVIQVCNDFLFVDSFIYFLFVGGVIFPEWKGGG